MPACSFRAATTGAGAPTPSVMGALGARPLVRALLHIGMRRRTGRKASRKAFGAAEAARSEGSSIFEAGGLIDSVVIDVVVNSDLSQCGCIIYKQKCDLYGWVQAFDLVLSIDTSEMIETLRSPVRSDARGARQQIGE